MHSVESKASRIDRIVGEIALQRRENRRVDFPSVARNYPELMPELGIRLAALQAKDDDSAARAGEQAIHPLLGGNFKDMDILETLDHGAQGVVYKALHRPTKRIVAIKLILQGTSATPEQRRRFEREVELIARLRHPNIVAVYDSGEIGGVSYLVAEYIEGLRVDDYVCVEQLPLTKTIELVCLICDAVTFAHSNGVLHRDLKPSNILVDEGGQPRILDFGLAKDIGSTTQATMTATGQVVGTLPYLSPEQIKGAVSDVRCDIYALGVILFELITGDYPYPICGDRLEALSNIIHKDPLTLRRALSVSGGGTVPNAQINADLEKIVQKALAKEPSRRYQTAADLAGDLRRYLAGEAVHARSASRIYVLRKTVRRFKAFFLTGAICLVLLVGSLVAVTAAWRRSEEVARIAMAALDMASLLKVGSVERDAGRLDHAVKLFDDAIQIGKRVNVDDLRITRQLCNAHHRLAELHFEKKNVDLAAAHASRTHKLAMHLVEREPANAEFQSQLAFAKIVIGRLHQERGDFDKAAVQFAQAADIQESLLRATPDNDSLAGDLAFTLGWRASCARRLKQFDQALALQLQAYEIVDAQVRAAPDNFSRQLDLARAQSRMSIIHLSFEDSAHDLMARDWLGSAQSTFDGIRAHQHAPQRQWSLDQLAYELNSNRQRLDLRLAESELARTD